MADGSSTAFTVLAIIIWLGSMFLKPLLKLLADRKAGAEPAQAAPEPIARARFVAAIGEQLAGLDVDRDRISSGVRTCGGPAAILGEVLDGLKVEHSQLHEQLAQLPSELQHSEAQKLQHTLRWQRFRLSAIEAMLSSRTSQNSAQMMADADAIAASLLRPFAEFCISQSIGFPEQRPICVPADPGHEAIWLGLLPRGYPTVFVPDDFAEDLLRWPSLAHELGHLLYNRVPGLAREVRLKTHLNLKSALFDPEQDADFRVLYAAWLEEIFSDFVAIVQLGPSAARGMVHIFGHDIIGGSKTQDSTSEIVLATENAYEEHPPAQLRVALALHLLRAMGFDREAKGIELVWQKVAGEPKPYIVPCAWDRMVEVDSTAFEAMGQAIVETLYTIQLDSLAQYPILAIPGFSMGPGLWAEALRYAEALSAGDMPHGDPRLLIAAAIETRSAKPSLGSQVARKVSRAIIGLGEQRYAHTHTEHVAENDAGTACDLLREAIFLRELLVPHHRRGVRRAPGRL